MELETAVTVITIIVALLGAVASFYSLSNSARKDAFDQLKVIVDQLKEKVDELETENEDLKDWAERLVRQVRAAGLEPEPYRRRKAGGDND